MPELSPNSGKTKSAQKLQAYLEGRSGERVLATDFINLCDRRPPDFLTWSQVMDETRHREGNDKPYRGRLPRTFMHYVISPDPRDNIDLPTLRELAYDWAWRFFENYEVAIVYHDDNTNHIPHAHVVINNTNLDDGHRLSSDLTNARVQEMNIELQRMALKLGLRAFSEDRHSLTEEEMAREGRQIGSKKHWRETMARAEGLPDRFGAKPPRRTLSKAQSGPAGMDSRPNYVSWKTEIQDRVDVARAISADEAQFKRVLAGMGITVSESRGGDYLFHHPLGGKKMVTGSRLGPVYTKPAIQRGFELGYVRWLQRTKLVAAAGATPVQLTEQQLEHVVSSMRASTSHGVPSDVRAADLVRLLDYNSRRSIKSLKDYGEGPEARAMARLAARVGIFDASGKASETSRMRDDARLVGRWIQESRAAVGAGGASYALGEGAQSAAEQSTHEASTERAKTRTKPDQAH